MEQIEGYFSLYIFLFPLNVGLTALIDEVYLQKRKKLDSSFKKYIKCVLSIPTMKQASLNV